VWFAGALPAPGAAWAAHLGLAAGAMQLGWQALAIRADETRALALFRSNRQFGLIVLLGLLADAAITAV
jgi:hypothetical protein